MHSSCRSILASDFTEQAWQADIEIASLTEVQANSGCCLGDDCKLIYGNKDR